MDDLDDLLNDLSRGSVRVTKSSARKSRPASSFVDLNELEDLMSDLSAPSGKQSQSNNATDALDAALAELGGSSSSSGSSQVRVSTLDFGLDDLSGPSTRKPAPANVRVSELDFGLGDLGNSKPATQSHYQQRPAPPQARVSELDFGLDDLGSGPAKAAPSHYQRTPQAPRVSTLDFGLDDLSSAAPARTPTHNQYGATPKAPVPAAAPKAPVAATMYDDDDDDLEALMNNLSAAPQPAAAPIVPSDGGGADYGGDFGGDGFEDAAPAGGGMGGGGGGGGGGDLDSLLSMMGDQMAGVDADDPAGRGKCAKCKKEITGEVLQAMGKHWHPECWACNNCGKAIGTGDFYDQDGLPHCDTCYKASFCPHCAHCNEPILDRCITALGKKWHVNCFICTQCLKGFPNGQFFEKAGMPYCEPCFASVHAPRCNACDGPIQGDCVNAIGMSFHPKCFVCSYCQKSFAGGTFFESGGKVFCQEHYNMQTGSVCKGCGKAISGRSVSALGSKYHPDCFVCAFCQNPLSGGNYSEKNGKAYCGACHARLFS